MFINVINKLLCFTDFWDGKTTLKELKRASQKILEKILVDQTNFLKDVSDNLRRLVEIGIEFSLAPTFQQNTCEMQKWKSHFECWKEKKTSSVRIEMKAGPVIIRNELKNICQNEWNASNYWDICRVSPLLQCGSISKRVKSLNVILFFRSLCLEFKFEQKK